MKIPFLNFDWLVDFGGCAFSWKCTVLNKCECVYAYWMKHSHTHTLCGKLYAYTQLVLSRSLFPCYTCKAIDTCIYEYEGMFSTEGHIHIWAIIASAHSFLQCVPYAYTIHTLDGKCGGWKKTILMLLKMESLFAASLKAFSNSHTQYIRK